MKKLGYILTVILLLINALPVRAALKTNCKYFYEKLNLPTRMFFNFNSFELIASEKRKLDKLISKLRTSEYNSITLVGHTDQRGTKQYNHQLGLKRATEVKRYLINEDITTHIKTESAGGERPLVMIYSSDCWVVNARVDIKIE